MPAIACYGGIGEIGRNNSLLEDGDTRLLFDFGTAFGRKQLFYKQSLRPRATRGLLGLLSLELTRAHYLPRADRVASQELADQRVRRYSLRRSSTISASAAACRAW
jgi:hypothetical protein